MQPIADLRYDTSVATILGERERQEDAVASDFSSDESFGFVVLADGMGGHAAGDVASKIVVTEVFSALKLASGDPKLLEPRICDVLEGAAENANECVGIYAGERQEADGMGATLLAPVLFGDRLYWVSVGDSPLYLFRNNKLERLNENHALMSQIDYIVDSGIMALDEAMNYPDQSCLTSVLIGKKIAQLDCRTVPVQIQEGDILVVASDGLQFLSEDEIERALQITQKRSADDIGEALLNDVRTLNDPGQDNVSVCIIKILGQEPKVDHKPENHTIKRSRSTGNTSITIIAKIKRSEKVAG